MNGPYKIGTLARLTGFSPALLRAWEKRFGLIAPERGGGRQRVYTDDDLVVLQRIRTLVDEGRAIGEIAAQGRGRLLMDADRAGAGRPESGVAREGASVFCQRVVDSALALDERQLGGALDDAFATLGADRAVADVIIPAEIRIGELWETGGCSVASEHLASSRFLHRLGGLLESAQPVNGSAPRVMAACFPDEHHQLGLLIIAWHLARHGVRVEFLGAAMPLEDLATACRTSRPRALLLSVMRRQLFHRHQKRLSRLLSGVAERVYVGGQGVPAAARAGRRIAFIHESGALDAVRRMVSDLGRA